MIVRALFVYGSLMRGQPAYRMWPHPATKVEAATLRADLFDLGPYPGIVAGDSIVLGELHYLDEQDWDETLAELDAFEEYDSSKPDAGLYRRELVNARMADRTEQAWAYFLVQADLIEGLGRQHPKIEENTSFCGEKCASWEIYRKNRNELSG